MLLFVATEVAAACNTMPAEHLFKLDCLFPFLINHLKLAKQGRLGRFSGVVCAVWPPTIWSKGILSMKNQYGHGLLSPLLVVFVTVVAAITVYATWGPVYEEQCVEPSVQEIEAAKRINEQVSSLYGGEYTPKAKCSKLRLR